MRYVKLEFECKGCNKEVVILDEETLFDLVNTQWVGEARKLYCNDCIDNCLEDVNDT